jgi:putative phage-type endonuclease
VTRDEWLAARRTGIGGSDIAAILGLSPWRTPLDVYREKIDGDQQPETEAMRWGRLLEDVIAREYAARAGVRIQRINTLIRARDREWAIATLDRVVLPARGRARVCGGELRGADGVLECKLVGPSGASMWGRGDDPDAVPLHCAAQCMWYLGITGLPWCDVAALIGGLRLIVRRIERDEETIAAMFARAETFWRDHVLARVPPPPSNAREAESAWPADNGEGLEADEELLQAYNAAREARARIAEAERDYDAAVERIKLALGERSVLTLHGRPIATWRATSARKIVDYEAVIREAAVPAEIIARHTTIQPGVRRFVLKESK